MSGELRMNRIKAREKGKLGLLGEVLRPEVLHSSVAKLGETAKNRIEHRNMMETFSALGKHTRANGFDPTRTFQHVANFDLEIWSLILEMFAKHNYETGELEDDGLLYKTDPATGALKLNKEFFYMLIKMLEDAGYPCDMRARIKLN